ncbi:type II secretion system F family protein [Serinibacter arcticus]|uniref:type II secretion system F family protein n=1 Tax=Serinibacter arcticus TaxID=1655435 RepID=UPI001304D275|nr:type II secretion system F family protein [Serinibacter arcticus]
MIVAGLALAVATWLTLGRGRGRLRTAQVAVVPGVELDPAVACDLVAAVLRAGASVPAALEHLGQAVGGEPGREVEVGARMLRFGAGWEEAFERAPTTWEPVLEALRLAWSDGVAPGPTLAATAGALRASRAARAREEAERLGVRLVLPLGLCLLPAFVLMGLVPVMVATGGDLLGWGR